MPTPSVSTAPGSRSRRPRRASGGPTAGAPVLDTAAAVLAMENGQVPPTPNVFDICHDLDLVMSSARPTELHTALVLSRGLIWAPTRRW